MKTTTEPAFNAYQKRCIEACSTVAGAHALASVLKNQFGSMQVPHWRRRLASTQAEMATKAAEHAKLQSELYDRLPAVYAKAEADAKSMVRAAERYVADAEVLEANAQTRIADFGGQVRRLKDGVDEATSRAATGLETAQARLTAAEAKEDMKAVAKASAELVSARDEQSRILASQSTAMVQMASAQSLLDKARIELSAALTALEDARLTHRLALASLAGVNADKATLSALSAYCAWARAGEGLHGIASDKCPGFFFVDAERSPFWDGKPGAQIFDRWKMRRFTQAHVEPSWEVFAEDPELLAEPA